jgi:hypothetical protein
MKDGMTSNEPFATGSESAKSTCWDAMLSSDTSRAQVDRDEIELPADVIERLEALDDVIFAAIDGDPEALDAAPTTWQCTLDELGWEMVEESRQQYLRFAKSVWEDTRHHPDDPDQKPFAAIQIIGLLVSVEQ